MKDVAEFAEGEIAAAKAAKSVLEQGGLAPSSENATGLLIIFEKFASHQATG
jgi:hypothetical protein